ncbi:MAG: hypothetical protein JNK05_38300 [Myxococcales bacterium]|nr:hypothetical protein [Myxococcales bacterium]
MNRSASTGRALRVLALVVFVGACDPMRPSDSGVANDATPADTNGSMPDADASGACTFVGAWQGTIAGGSFAGQSLQWTFEQSTWTAAISAGSIRGTWSLSGSALEVNDTSAMPAFLACPVADRGVYAVSFDPTCATVRLTTTTEPCDGRRAYADGITLTRR